MDSTILGNSYYQYDEDSYLIARKSSPIGQTPLSVTYFYHDMNVDSAIVDPPDKILSEQFLYDRTHANTLTYANVGISFMGKSCRNLLVEAKTIYHNLIYAQYFYAFDPYDRVIKLSVRGVSMMPGLEFSIPGTSAYQDVYYTYY